VTRRVRQDCEPAGPRRRITPIRSLWNTFIGFENRAHALLVRYSIVALRISIGATFFAFGILKYFPGVSPAENLARTTSHILFLGLVPGGVAVVLIATLECTIGLLLMSGRGLRIAVYLLVGELIGILSPLVLLTGRLFAGPHGAPTLEGQYVLKDIVLVTAAMVIAAASFRGGRLVREEPPPTPALSLGRARTVAARRKLEVVLSTIGGGRSVDEVCSEHGISRATYHEWRDQALHAAGKALEEPTPNERVGGPRSRGR